MSHISRMKIRIKEINKTILEKTIEQLKSEYRVRLVEGNSMEDLFVRIYGDYIIGVHTGGHERFIGLKKTGDGVEMIYDDYGWEDELNKFISDFQKTYISTAIVMVAREMGYKDVLKTKNEKGIYIELVAG